MSIALKIILALTPALPGIIADFESLAKDAEAKGETIDQRAKDALSAVGDLIKIVSGLL